LSNGGAGAQAGGGGGGSERSSTTYYSGATGLVRITYTVTESSLHFISPSGGVAYGGIYY
jgi:hypothetical protein